jgi:deoxyribonuclease V
VRICAFDVHYREDGKASAAAVCFHDFADAVYAKAYQHLMPVPGRYISGEFYLRELPCILELINKMDNPPEVALVDGYVTLGARPGLGRHLYEAGQGQYAVIGVAKSPHLRAQGAEVYRGGSRKPLYVTSAGIDLEIACRSIRRMHGAHRIPTLLQQVDRLARQGAVPLPPETDQTIMRWP